MGKYLNPGAGNFLREINSEIYVDKTGILKYTNKVINTMQCDICVSRPRRFGKSMTADMISAYYDRSIDSASLFKGLEIYSDYNFDKFRNKYNVLKINIQEFLSRTNSVSELLIRLKTLILNELIDEYPDVNYFDRQDMMESLKDIFLDTKIPFVVIIDEWDCIFREFPDDKDAQDIYLDFLRDWLKDKEYIALCYMTGILPIKKYGTHSALNMFYEFSMENPRNLAEFVGFTEEEVKALCTKYDMDYDTCKAWYNGYSFKKCDSVFCPNSIVSAMLSGIFDDYWNQTETYQALKIYIDMNYDGLKDSIIKLIAGEQIEIDTGGFQNDMTSFEKADDVLTLLIHLGYLGYDFDKHKVFIPNQEIMREFITATTGGNPWYEIMNSVKKSSDLLASTWALDSEKVAAGIEKAHLETSHIQYNDENALSYTISLAYYAARQYYTVVREMPSGKGFADVVFIPRKKYIDKPAMLVELKWDKSASTALGQIKEKNYPEALKEYKGNILLVGINYDKKTKAHRCIIEKG